MMCCFIACMVVISIVVMMVVVIVVMFVSFPFIAIVPVFILTTIVTPIQRALLLVRQAKRRGSSLRQSQDQLGATQEGKNKNRSHCVWNDKVKRKQGGGPCLYRCNGKRSGFDKGDLFPFLWTEPPLYLKSRQKVLFVAILT